PANPNAAALSIGLAPRNAGNKVSYGMGHPVDRLALERPDLIPPREGGKKIVIVPRHGTNADGTAKLPTTSAKVSSAATNNRAQDNDDDDDDDDKPRANVDFGPYMTKMKKDIQKKWHPPKGLESRRIVATFSIARDGRIMNPKLVDGSGLPEADKSAM